MSALVAAVGLQREQLVQASSSRSVALTATIQLLFSETSERQTSTIEEAKQLTPAKRRVWCGAGRAGAGRSQRLGLGGGRRIEGVG